MSHASIFLVLVAFALYSLVVAWRREAQANALVIPLALSSLQLAIVLVSTYVLDMAGQPDGPDVTALVAVFFKGLLPLSLVQMFLLVRREPAIFQRTNIRWPLSLVLGRQGWGWLMILVMAQLALASASNTATWTSVDLAILALHLATLFAMLLIQLGRLGPRPPEAMNEAGG